MRARACVFVCVCEGGDIWYKTVAQKVCACVCVCLFLCMCVCTGVHACAHKEHVLPKTQLYICVCERNNVQPKTCVYGYKGEKSCPATKLSSVVKFLFKMVILNSRLHCVAWVCCQKFLCN